MVPYMEPFQNLFFAGKTQGMLLFSQLIYKCKDKYFVYWFRCAIYNKNRIQFYLRVIVENYNT